MATIVKLWDNGDELTLVTSGSGISITSDPNLTGSPRQKTIRIQTTDGGLYQDVVVNQGIQSAVQDGYWVHKDTNAVTYFGADADFITDGVMSRPSWIANAKEIRLCTGITEFEVTHYSDPFWGDFDWCAVFHITPEGPTYSGNDVLEKIDFGNAEVEVLPESLFYLATALTEAILNDNVVTIHNFIFDSCESLECVDIGSGVEYIGYNVFGNCPNLDLVYIRATTPPTGDWRTSFGTINANLQLKVPSASVSAYITAITDATLKSKVTAI